MPAILSPPRICITMVISTKTVGSSNDWNGIMSDVTERIADFELRVQKKLDNSAAALKKAKQEIAETSADHVVSSFPIDKLIKAQGQVIAWATTKELIGSIKKIDGSAEDRPAEEAFAQLLKQVTHQVVSTSWASSSSNVDVELKLSTHGGWTDVLEEMGWVK